MKSIKASILFIIVLLAFFSTMVFFENRESISVFTQLTSPDHRISKELLEAYENGDAETKSEARTKLIQIALKNLQYDKWLEYQEYIELNIYRGHILPNSSSQLLIALNLSKDQAVIAVFDYINNGYLYKTALENLLPVADLQFLPNAEVGYDYLVITQIMDETLGAYLYERYMDIYLYGSEGLNKVWNKTLFYQETYKEIWINPNASDTIWNRVEETTLVDFIKGTPFKINTVTTRKKMVSQSKAMPKDTQFSILKSDTSKTSYYWDSRFNTFIIIEISNEVFLTKAALLEDMELSRESLYGVDNKSYKIKTLKGEIIYLPKSSFSGLFKNLLEE